MYKSYCTSQDADAFFMNVDKKAGFVATFEKGFPPGKPRPGRERQREPSGRAWTHTIDVAAASADA
jgi:hypothetical protein